LDKYIADASTTERIVVP